MVDGKSTGIMYFLMIDQLLLMSNSFKWHVYGSKRDSLTLNPKMNSDCF